MRIRTLATVQSPFFWLGLSLLAALSFALVSSDGLAWLARESAAYQRQIQHQLTTSLQDVGSGAGSAAALWILLSLCFSYGVVHTLGPGHGKAVIVAYFLDGTEPRRWIEGLFAGAWIAITHTLSALILATSLKLMSVVGLFGALAHARLVEIASYLLILAVGLWRLRAGLRGETAACNHDHGGHGHHHGHDHGTHTHHHDHAPHPPRLADARSAGFLHRRSGLMLLSAAGAAPCAGALILVLLSLALDVLWAGIVGVIAIAAGMALALAAIGMASMLAHRLIVGEDRSTAFGRAIAVASSLVVIATASVLLLGAVARQMGWS
jgi:ABC-type nickel/cobalt efflux system permease component RcnA